MPRVEMTAEQRAEVEAAQRQGLETAALRVGSARPGVRGQKGAVAEQARATVASGREVWFGDETTLRECPPLRAAWAKRGEPANVTISGRNGRGYCMAR